MKIKKTQINVVFIRFLPFNCCIEIKLKNNIYNEQFSSLAFYFHFLTIQLYSFNNTLSWPNDGWITLDKVNENDTILMNLELNFSTLQDVCKFIKKKVSYDLRCLKNFENELYKNRAMLKFIEDVANTDNNLFKRVQLRQLKRVFNQRLALCEFKTKNQPSKFKNLSDIWEFIKTTLKKWYKLDELKEDELKLNYEFDFTFE